MRLRLNIDWPGVFVEHMNATVSVPVPAGPAAVTLIGPPMAASMGLPSGVPLTQFFQ